MLILDPVRKLRTVDEYDCTESAEIPDADLAHATIEHE